MRIRKTSLRLADGTTAMLSRIQVRDSDDSQSIPFIKPEILLRKENGKAAV